MIGSWDIFRKIALRWMSLDLIDKSTLVQVMAWCRQATSHYLSQCWPRFMSPHGVTRPQSVNSLWPCECRIADGVLELGQHWFNLLRLPHVPDSNDLFPEPHLTHCGLVTPYSDKIWVSIRSGNSLLPDSTKPLSLPMLTSSLVGFCDIHQSLSEWLSQYSV